MRSLIKPKTLAVMAPQEIQYAELPYEAEKEHNFRKHPNSEDGNCLHCNGSAPLCITSLGVEKWKGASGKFIELLAVLPLSSRHLTARGQVRAQNQELHAFCNAQRDVPMTIGHT